MPTISPNTSRWFSWDSIKGLEKSKNILREKVEICKEKAGIHGNKYPVPIDAWKKEIIGLANGIEKTSFLDPLPSQASSKNGLGYNREIARAITNKDLQGLSRNVSKYTNLWLLHTHVGAGKKVDPAILLDIVAKSEKTPDVNPLELYISRAGNKLSWWQVLGLRVLHWGFSGFTSRLIESSFQNLLKEIRFSTEGKMEPIFENLLVHLSRFLKDYRGETPLEDFTEKKEVAELCRELAPFLVKECFPNIRFFNVSLLDATIGSFFNWVVHRQLRGALPFVLQNLSEMVLANLTADPSTVYPVNYRFANPVIRFINDKLFAFATELKKPPLEIPDPTPPRIAEKLAEVVDELMKLSVHRSENEEIRDGLRNGLIDGGYELMKYWQREQENILQQLLSLASLPFTEAGEASDIESDRAEYKELWKAQNERVDLVCNRIIDLEVKKRVSGVPSSQVNYHLDTSHKKTKRFLEEGLSDLIGLKSTLQKASKDLEKSGYRGFDVVLGKHLVFWESFLDLMKESTKPHYPSRANEALIQNFYPLCDEASAQVSRISQLQDEWMLYTRHQELKDLFCSLLRAVDRKKLQDIDVSAVKFLINKIEVLLPPNPIEVQVLKKFMEIFESLKNTGTILQDLEKLKISLKTKRKGAVDFAEGATEMKLLLAKHPKLREDRECILLYKKYNSLLQNRFHVETGSIESVLKEIIHKIEREIGEQWQYLKDLQLSLLHRIHPDKQSSSFNVPLPMSSLVKQLSSWVLSKEHGYEVLEGQNRAALQIGAQDLLRHADFLEGKVRTMQPSRLYFPLEIFHWCLEKAPVVNLLFEAYKRQLFQEVSGILIGVTPLITAKKEEGKKHLYSWIERLALYEAVKHFKNKKDN
jgi:hypothetical protein